MFAHMDVFGMKTRTIFQQCSLYRVFHFEFLCRIKKSKLVSYLRIENPSFRELASKIHNVVGTPSVHYNCQNKNLSSFLEIAHTNSTNCMSRQVIKKLGLTFKTVWLRPCGCRTRKKNQTNNHRLVIEVTQQWVLVII